MSYDGNRMYLLVYNGSLYNRSISSFNLEEYKMKSFTDLEQSKKLAEILPFESADYSYITQGEESYIYPYSLSSDVAKHYDKEIKYIPCWSLAALLDVLPKSLIYTPNQVLDGYCCKNIMHDLETYGDNPVDACVKMILKLHEHKLL